MVSEVKKVEKFIGADEMAKDGYTNLPARLGEASPLQSSGEYTREDVTRNYELLTVLYRENWIAKRIIDMPCEDMTRAWYSLSTELSQSAIDKIKKVEAKHNVKGEITNALRWARLYGGSLALMVIKGQEDMLDEPLDYDMIMPGSFKGLLILDKVTGISPSLELEEDMDDPDFGLPLYYEVVIDSMDSKFVKIHHSRVLRFIGRDLPPQEEIREDYWGASELEHIYEELQKRNATSANIAQLVFQANTRVLKMADYGEVIGMGTNKQKKEVLNAIEAQNRLLTSFGVQIMGTDDNMESHPYSFSGISDVYESFMMDMAGAANIPATKLFGRAPQGMNATGESDMNNYYESISQMQERSLKPALEKLLPVMCMSVFGAIPDDMEIVFEPIATTTPEQRANIAGQFTGTVIDTFSAGLIGRKTALMELREMGKEIGAWTKISDETIEEADDEVDQGEMGGGMPGEEGGMEMMGGGGQVPPEGMPPEMQAPPEEQGMPTQAQLEEGKGQPQVQVEEPEKDSTPDGDIMSNLEDDLDNILLEHDKVGFIQRMVERLFRRKKKLNDGGEGSGNFNHEGRPGLVGGSQPTKGSSGNSQSESKQDAEYRQKVSVMRDKAQKWTPNHKAYFMYSQGLMTDEDAYNAGEDGTIDKYLEKYFDALESNGDPEPTKPLRNQVSLYNEVEKEKKHGGDYIQARKDYIKDWTGCSDEEASETLNQFNTWFDGRWTSADTDTIDSYIDKDGAYDGEIYRGMKFTEDEYKQFMEGLEPGAKIGMKGFNASWTNDKETAVGFSHGRDRSVVIKCIGNKTSAPVAHLSTHGEDEVISHSKAQWTVLGVAEGNHRTEITVIESSQRMSDSEREKRRKNEFGGVVHDSQNNQEERMNQQNKYFGIVNEYVSDGGEGSGNFGHAGDPPNVGGSAPSGGGSSGSGNHHTKDEFKSAVKECIKGNFSSLIDMDGMNKHRDLKSSEKAAKIQFEEDEKQYAKDIKNGKKPHEPVFRLKSYFDGVSASVALKQALTMIDKGRFKWYTVKGGELRAQVEFKKPVGFSISKDGSKVPTNFVTVVYSTKKDRGRVKGFHCFPDWEREGEEDVKDS